MTSYGMDVTICSSKMIQYQEREVVIPVVKSSSPLYPVKWIRRYSRAYPSTGPLFCVPGSDKPPTYLWYLNKLVTIHG